MTEITIIGTKGANLGVVNCEVVGRYEVIDKDTLIKRIEELTDEGVGYTILKVEEDES